IADSSTGQDAFRPKFTGKEYDSKSELYYFGARYYDGHLGRFLSPDPARQYFSPYVYGNGDPLSGIDPNGAQFITLLIIGIGALVGAYMGGAAVNHSYNPASWDWSSGKTWGGILGGAALGGAAAGVGAVAGGAIAAAGLGTIGTAAAEMAVAGGVMGTMNASFTAMAGGSIGDVAKSFGIGFGMGALFAVPGVGQVAFAGMVGYDTYKTIADPSVGNGIQLGIDILFLGMEAGMRLSEGGREYKEVGGCASFVAGTEVATAEGEKAVEEVAVGDTVLAYNEETGEEGEYPVSHLFTRIAPESLVVTVGEEAITTTPEHEFYTSNGWVEAEDLSVGDTLVRLGGEIATVTDLESHQDSTRVYNFEVDEAHTYYVSGKGLLVHNMYECSAQGVKDIRNNPNEKFKIGRKRNVAIGKLTDREGKVLYNEYAVAGEQAQRGVRLQNDARAFTPIEINGGENRAWDSEVHLLEDLHNKIKSKPEYQKGNLELYSERDYCLSCQGIIDQFSRKYPQINIKMYYGDSRQNSYSIENGMREAHFK
ncbi:MAG: hypothetical protein GDA44_12510, partial [Prochloron sp. SP5CPC1]|nr:hypothetical protein [Candidatus Paraprochloron terpiosi SP5CPC1]